MPSALLEATTAPDVVDVDGRAALAIDGAGPPEDPGFQEAMGALYGVAYGLKFARKPAGRDFKIGPLEGRWWAEGAPERFCSWKSSRSPEGADRRDEGGLSLAGRRPS
jgi:hypothetical protein